MRHRLNTYELVPAADWTWIADSQEDVFGNIRTYPLGVPLCCGCDGLVTEGKCHSCEVEFVSESETPPELLPENRERWVA